MAHVTNQGTREKTKDAISTATDKTKDAAATVADKAGEMASKAVDKASQFASTVGDKADDATASVGSGLKSAAGSIRENLPSKGMLGAASEGVADTLESSGKYLEDRGLSGMSEDVAGMIKRYPIPAVLLAVGVGYLIACSSRS